MNFIWEMAALVIGTVGALFLVWLAMVLFVGLPSLIWEALLDRLER